MAFVCISIHGLTFKQSVPKKMLRLLLKALNEQMEYEWIQGNSPWHQRCGQIEDIEYKLLLVFAEPPSYQRHCQVRISD